MKIVHGTAKGLEYLHEKANPPVIYRDLKSPNILLDEEYNPKLSDFGLAKLGPVGEKTSGCKYLFFVCSSFLCGVAWFSCWFDNLGLITKGNTYRSRAASSLPLWGNTYVVQANINILRRSLSVEPL